MARALRSSRRRASPSQTDTPISTTSTSPFFSAKNSSIGTNTPATSVADDEKQEDLKTSLRRSLRGNTAKKRALENEEDGEENDSVPLTKKRNTGRGLKKTTKTEGEFISSQVYVELDAKRSFETPQKNTAKKKASVKNLKSVVEEDEDEEEPVELISDDEAVYDEQEESDDSGSVFELSEMEQDDDDEQDFEEIAVQPRKSPRKSNGIITDDEDESDTSDAEALMLKAAMQISKRTAALEASGNAGPSTGTLEVDSPAALRAAAAERRLAKSKALEGGYMLPSDEGEFDDEDASSEDEPLAKGKTKGKGKAKAKAKAKASAPKKKAKQMTLAELKKQRREERKLRRLERRGDKAEEVELRRTLGRRLTYAEKATLALHKHHPELRTVWGDLETRVKPVSPEKAEQPEELKITLLPFQQESLYWMRKQEEGIWKGGMLADEMGMGKTIQTLALLVSDQNKPNLVVAPTVAIMQWKNEIEAFTDGIKVAVWHGAAREGKISELKKFNVVLTTYAVLESAFRKQQSGFKRNGRIIKEKSPVHQIHWNRIILDEAHNIKERSTNTAKAAFELKSNYKWCLSGTPLQNRVGELYSLVRFLGGDPFSYYFCKKCDCKSLHWRFEDKRTCDDCHHSPMQHTCFWNNEILTPIQKHGLAGPGEIAFKKLRILLDRMMLRRTKIERADDLGLPPRTVTVRRDYFSPEEKDLYLSLFSDAKRQFSYYVDQGTLLNNYSNIFSLITRMRQMACHPDLVLRSKQNANKFNADDLGEATVCRLCNDIAEDAIQSKCRHIFDRECIKQYINTAVEQVPECPVCHLPLTIDLEAPALEIDAEAANHVRQGILGRLDVDKWRSSSKIEALVEELTNLRKQDATTKSLVFSQFVNFLDLIAFRLQRAGFTICRLEGNMSPQARDATIKHFMNNVHVTVFLVSLKAGGVALNLTEASRVYLMDSWWNPAVEFQAMDRIHRLGQHRPVQAIKLVIEDSIESRIVQLQEKKSAMIDATLSTDDSAMGRLTPEDLSFLFRL